jgi:hypothetical protein
MISSLNAPRIITRKYWVPLLLAGVITSCNFPLEQVSEPSFLPVVDPTTTPMAITPISPENTPAQQPFTNSTQAVIIEPEHNPTPTQAPPSVSVSLEEISILSPGPGSHVTNPIQVSGFGGPSQTDRVHVELIGEDGRVISRGYTYLYVLPGNAGQFYAEVPFVSSLVAEQAWIVVRSFGERYGELRHLTTQEIVLLSTGSPKIYPAIRGAEKISIFRPRGNSIVEGGRLLVQGAGWTDREGSFRVEIKDRLGNVLGSASAEVESGTYGQLGPFAVEVEYETPFPQWARVAVSEWSDSHPGLIHYTSVEVWLRP